MKKCTCCGKEECCCDKCEECECCGKEEKKEVFDKKDEAKIRKRLKSLGYM